MNKKEIEMKTLKEIQSIRRKKLERKGRDKKEEGKVQKMEKIRRDEGDWGQSRKEGGCGQKKEPGEGEEGATSCRSGRENCFNSLTFTLFFSL